MVAYKRRYAHAYMRRLARAALQSRVSLVKWRRSSSRTLGSYSSQLLLLLHIVHCEKRLRMGERSSLVIESWSQDLPVEL